jgi:hypothetical protein
MAINGGVSLVESDIRGPNIHDSRGDLVRFREVGSAGITVWSLSVIGAADSFPG